MKPATVISVPGQHREGGGAVGEARRVETRQALLQLSLHHLDGDHRVVDQEAERDDQRAERDALEIDAEFVHEGEGRGEHQRNGDRDDEAGTPADRDERDDEHDGERLDQRFGELVDGVGDDRGLIGNLRDLDAVRQRRFEIGQGRVDVLADAGDVEARRHDDADLDRVLAVEAVLAGERVLEAASDGRDVAETHDLAAELETELGQILGPDDIAADGDAHRAGARLDARRPRRHCSGRRAHSGCRAPKCRARPAPWRKRRCRASPAGRRG